MNNGNSSSSIRVVEARFTLEMWHHRLGPYMHVQSCVFGLCSPFIVHGYAYVIWCIEYVLSLCGLFIVVTFGWICVVLGRVC